MSYHVPHPDDEATVPQFPTDPRYTYGLRLPVADAAALKKPAWLSTALLDFILQRTALRPDFSTESAPAMMGHCGSEAFMSSMNFTASLKRGAVTDLEWNKYQEQIDRVRGRLKNFLNHSIQEGDVPQRLVFPIVSPPDQIGHLFVACFDFSVNHPHFFVDVCFYDSLERSKSGFIGQVRLLLMSKSQHFLQELHSP